MGFMDKAKKLAEQAQQKLDEAQEQFNQGQKAPAEQGSGARYDQHGRPVEGTPAGDTAPPSAEPADAGPAPTEEPAPKADTGDSDANPDPFKPIQ
jgi:hypothetical protein